MPSIWTESQPPATRAARGDPESGCPCPGVQAAVPDGDDEVRVADGQGTGEVGGVRTSERVLPGEVAGLALHRFISDRRRRSSAANALTSER